MLEDDVSEMPKNWNRRFKHNRDKIKTGDIYELTEVVRNLAIREHQKPFVRCTEPDQIAILKALDASSGPGHNFFRLAKSLTASIYYATEAG